MDMVIVRDRVSSTDLRCFPIHLSSLAGEEACKVACQCASAVAARQAVCSWFHFRCMASKGLVQGMLERQI